VGPRVDVDDDRNDVVGWMCVCLRNYVHVYAHTHTRAHTHTYTHTHIHTRTQSHSHTHTLCGALWRRWSALSLCSWALRYSLFVGSTVLFVRGLYGTLCSWALRYSLFVGSTVAVDYIVHICSTLSTYMVDLDH